MNAIKVLMALTVLRGSDPETEKILTDIFTRGNCGNLAIALNFILPGSKLVSIKRGQHYAVEFDGQFLDITGALDLDPLDVEYVKRHEVLVDNYDAEVNGPVI